MNDSELESRLKSVRVPERTGDYWDDFPARVRVQLRREQTDFAPHSAPRSAWRARLKLASTFAMAVGLIWVGERFHPLATTSAAITRHTVALRAEMARLEQGMSLVAFNPHGMGYLIAETN